MISEKIIWIAAAVSTLALAIPPSVAAQDTQYKLVNLGTGFVNVEWGANGAPALNANGTIVGAVTTPTLTTAANNPLICGPTSTGNFPFVLHTFEERNDVSKDLGSIPPQESNCSIPSQVNAYGEVVGMTEINELDPLRGFKQVRAVIWKDGQIIDIGALDGNESEAGTINSHGQIAGNYLNLVPDSYSFIDLMIFGASNGTEARGFFWQNGTIQDIGTLGGSDTGVTLMNEAGQVVGFSYTNTAPNATTGFPTIDPFIWRDGKMTDLGTLGGTVGMPNWVNNHGQVVGISNLAGDLQADPFLWTQGKLFDLDAISTGGQPIFADAIDDAGVVIGPAAFPNASYDAYIWKNGVVTDLGHVPGDCFSEAFGINSDEQVVGNSFSCDGTQSHAFLWEQGTLVDLNDLVPPDSPPLAFAVSINDRREIAAGDNNGNIYLLIPTRPPDLKALSAHSSASVRTEPKPTPGEIAAMRAMHVRGTSRTWSRH